MDIPNDKNIKVVMDEIRDMKDDVRNQIGFLLYTQVDRQRAECSTKLIFHRIDRQCHLQS